MKWSETRLTYLKGLGLYLAGLDLWYRFVKSLSCCVIGPLYLTSDVLNDDKNIFPTNMTFGNDNIQAEKKRVDLCTTKSHDLILLSTQPLLPNERVSLYVVARIHVLTPPSS